ncbi:ABC transporter substrate-binding protein [Ruania rhizosphaerae]|uniref:ABC transporter substrate-binding protein n=1 Tax=Ruania rhizosphaerae TaxID=1840413 RepID=UPI0013597128|nr:ABC transporter substrate-binding protein [Ruania rhizosphaerae]
MATVSAVAAMSLAACSPSGEGAETVVRIANPITDFWGDPLQEAAAVYEEQNDGIRIEIDSVPYDSYEEVLQTQLVGETAADILFLEPPAVANFSGRDFLLALDDELSPTTEWGETFVSGMLDATRSPDGRQYVVPWSSVAVLIAYRQSEFSAVGSNEAPVTFSEWIDVMNRLESEPAPLNVSLRGDDASLFWILTNKLEATLRPLTEDINLLHADDWAYDPDDLASTLGETYTTDELYVAFETGLIDPAQSPGYRAAVEQVVQLSPFINEDSATVQPADVAQRFGAGEIPQLIGVGGTIAEVGAEAADSEDIATFNLPTITQDDFPGLAAGGENPLAGPRNGFAVNAASEVQAEALDFLRFLTQPDTVSDMYRVQVQGDPSAVDGVAYPDDSVLQETDGQEFAQISPYGFGAPPTFDTQDTDEFHAQWQSLLTGNSSVDEFLEDRSASNRAALERNLVLEEDSIDQSFIDEQLGQ